MIRPILVAAFLLSMPAVALAGPDCAAHAAKEQPKAAAPSAKKADAEKTYTCPMHPSVQQKGPGKCPDCGMFLEPKK